MELRRMKPGFYFLPFQWRGYCGARLWTQAVSGRQRLTSAILKIINIYFVTLSFGKRPYEGGCVRKFFCYQHRHDVPKILCLIIRVLCSERHVHVQTAGPGGFAIRGDLYPVQHLLYHQRSLYHFIKSIFIRWVNVYHQSVRIIEGLYT